MAEDLGRAVLHLEADGGGFSRSLGLAHKQAGSFVGAAGAGFKKVGKIALLAAGAGGLGAIAATLKVGYDEWKQSTQVTAQTEAVLKSTGKAAHVTAKQVDDLSTSLMRKSGIDDEAIKSGENLLLTFTGIRNEVGKGNDIFNQATTAMTDMSVALGQDMKSSAIQLGKALNDPVKGITALRRVGVSFTAGQIEQVKAMVKAGKTMDAQKFILRELNREFGGSAKAAGQTLPGQLNILKESFNNLAGDIFKSVVPSLQQVVTWTTAHWPEIEATFKAVFTAIGATIRAGVAAVKAIIPIVAAVVDWVRTNWPQISATFMSVFNAVKSIVTAAVAIILGLWNTFGATILAQLRATWEFVKSYLQGVFNVIAGMFHIIHALLTGDWTELWNGIKQVFTGIAQQITAVVKLFADSVVNILRLAGSLMLAAVREPWNAIKALAVAVFDGITAVIRGAVDGIVSAARAIGNGVHAAISAGLSTLRSIGADAMAGLLSALRAGWQPITGWLSSLGEFMRSLVGGAGRWLYDAGKAVMQGFWDGLKEIWGKITGWLSGLGGAISSLKGPIDYDYRLLQPHGRAIMAGLYKGMFEGASPVFALASGVARSIGASFAGGAPVVGLPSSASPTAGRSGGWPERIQLVVDGRVLGEVTRAQLGRYAMNNGLASPIPVRT